jgi:hypothetical protein
MRETAGRAQVVTSAGGGTAVCGAWCVPSGLLDHACDEQRPAGRWPVGEQLPSLVGEQAQRGLSLAGNRS